MNVKNPFRRPTLTEDAQKRYEAAKRLLDHHMIGAADMRDTAAWAEAKARGHDELASMYRQRMEAIMPTLTDEQPEEGQP